MADKPMPEDMAVDPATVLRRCQWVIDRNRDAPPEALEQYTTPGALARRVLHAEEDVRHAVAQARGRVPDYPWAENTASEAVWALGESLRGVSAANDDLHAERARLLAVNRDLLAACEAGLALLVRCQGAECWCTDPAEGAGASVICSGCKLRAAVLKAKGG